MTEAAVSQVSVPLAFVLDISLALILFAVKAALLAGVLTLVTRREAVIHLKTCALGVVLLGIAYFACDTTPEALLSIRAFLLASLIGTFFCMKLFEVDWEKSLISCLLFCCLSILMDSYSQRWVDRLLPGRTTIGRTLASAIDSRTRRTARDASLPPTTGVMPALLRLAMTPGSDGVVDAVLAPMRAAQQAKVKIAEISKQAAEEAAIANMLSGAGTNVGNRTEEMKALKQGLVAEAHGGSVPVTVADAAPPAISPTNPPVAVATAAAPALAAAPIAPPTASSSAPPVVVSAPAASATRPAAPTPVAVAAAPAGHPNKAGAITGMRAEDRQNWEAARRQIRVSSVVRSSRTAYIMIGSRMLRLGDTHQVTYNGRECAFRFSGVDAQGACQWEPVLPKAESETDFVAF